MLNLLDQTIKKVLDVGWTAPPPKPDFYFTIPDDGWRAKVKSGTQPRLDIYLYEVRERRDMRRSQFDPLPLADGTVALSRPPAYIDCHYLISAWSPAEDSEALNPVLDEHAMLAETLRVLFRNPDVVPNALGITGGGPVFQEAHVELTVAAPEAAKMLNDFWTTMKSPWRPAIQLVATAPLDLLRDEPPDVLVTTFIQRFLLQGGSEAEERIQIGGWVLRAADDTPIADATVRRVGAAQQAVTDAAGRFTIAALSRAVHRIRVEAAGFAPLERDLDVPDGPPTDHVFKLS